MADTRITAVDVKALIGSKEDYHESMLRNGYYVPGLRSPLVTIEYLSKVRSKEIYVPMYTDVRLRPCPRPPNRDTLAQYVLDAAEQAGKADLGFSMKRGNFPNGAWLLNVLSTLNPDH